MEAESSVPTPWAVRCKECGKPVFMVSEFYNAQSRQVNGWICPRCFGDAEWDGDAEEDDVSEEIRAQMRWLVQWTV